MYAGKRALDIAGSLIGIVVFSPVWAVSVFLILTLDGCPVTYRQQRLGKGFKSFTVYKLRTLNTDGLVTRSGRWLRKTGIDESLQFFCVLKGDMSLVGPRPLIRSDLTKLGWESPRLQWRWSIKPGITGLAQVHERWATRRSLAYDRAYLRTASLCLDVYTLAISFTMNMFGKDRVRRWLHW